MKKEYKVEVVKESALSSLFLGSSKMPIKKMEAIMNKYGQEGWDVSFQVIEKRRLLFFWTREAVVITFVRSIN
ncbi:MAG: Uncharacterised protein [Cryomorphaceae bacterium]|nr:MAG: Uncharacterised protein [Cryomorphaceae bacterium]|tara:strand:+ start:114 stop:332 length:219 start_codon:yes stop_codon:yes gene_type:complete